MNRDLCVIGASAGGISALVELMAGLPADSRIAFLVVVHTSPSSPGVLATILDRAGPLPAEFARQHQRIHPGHIYVAPADLHMLVKDGTILLTHGPKENGFRPAVDPLFRTAARACGRRTIGIVLSGGLDDGTDGLRLIKECGGAAIVQHPDEATFPSMPSSAIRNVTVDQIATVAEMPAILERLSKSAPPEAPAMCPPPADPEHIDVAAEGDHALTSHHLQGSPSALTCPECGGALWEQRTGNQLRYRCHVGHVYTGDGMVDEVDRTLEQALWSAVRIMEEAASLRRRMARMAREGQWSQYAPPYETDAREIESKAEVLRKLLRENLARHRQSGATISGEDVHASSRRGKMPRKTASPARSRRRKHS